MGAHVQSALKALIRGIWHGVSPFDIEFRALCGIALQNKVLKAVFEKNPKGV